MYFVLSGDNPSKLSVSGLDMTSPNISNPELLYIRSQESSWIWIYFSFQVGIINGNAALTVYTRVSGSDLLAGLSALLHCATFAILMMSKGLTRIKHNWLICVMRAGLLSLFHQTIFLASFFSLWRNERPRIKRSQCFISLSPDRTLLLLIPPTFFLSSLTSHTSVFYNIMLAVIR